MNKIEMESKLVDLQDALEIKQDELKELETDRDSIELEESDYETSYQDLINESGDVEIMGMSYNASHVLEEVDPIAYRCGLSDYVNGINIEKTNKYINMQKEIDDLEYDISNMQDDIDDLESEIDDLDETDDE